MSIAELNTPLKTSPVNSVFRHILVATDFSAAFPPCSLQRVGVGIGK